MFGKKEAQPQKRIDGLIAAGTIVRGDIIFSGGLRIDGSVEGKISTNNGDAGTLVISEQAQVDGEIKVSHVVVNGTVRGPIIADDYLDLQAKARIVGDVTYRKLEMQLGAVVQGRLCHNEPGVASVVEIKRAPAESGATGATR